MLFKFYFLIRFYLGCVRELLIEFYKIACGAVETKLLPVFKLLIHLHWAFLSLCPSALPKYEPVYLTVCCHLPVLCHISIWPSCLMLPLRSILHFHCDSL